MKGMDGMFIMYSYVHTLADRVWLKCRDWNSKAPIRIVENSLCKQREEIICHWLFAWYMHEEIMCENIWKLEHKIQTIVRIVSRSHFHEYVALQSYKRKAPLSNEGFIGDPLQQIIIVKVHIRSSRSLMSQQTTQYEFQVVIFGAWSLNLWLRNYAIANNCIRQ